MLKEIINKKNALYSHKPFSDDFITTYSNLNLLDLAYMNLKLDGSTLTKEGVNQIIKGEIIKNVPLMEHHEVGYYKDVLKTFKDMLQMDMDLDEKQLIRLYKVLTGQSDIQIRNGNAMLYHLDYIPPDHSGIMDALKNVFIQTYKNDFGGDFFRKAVAVHNRIIEIYPFNKKNEALARTAMEYELVCNDIPVVPFEMDESSYNRAFSKYLKTGEFDDLYNDLMSSASDKLDLLLNVLREEDMAR